MTGLPSHLRVGALVLVGVLAAPALVACADMGDDRVTPQGRESGTGKTARAQPDTQPDHAAPAPDLRPRGPVSRGWTVSRVVDGDTVEVTRGGRTLDIRLIGIDTPETVHPTEPVECFGPEASAYATRALLDEPVVLEFDRSQGRQDYYGRTLAYVWRPGRALFNLDAVRRGYALEYTYESAYAWQRELQRAERRAKTARVGVWRCPHPGS